MYTDINTSTVVKTLKIEGKFMQACGYNVV